MDKYNNLQTGDLLLFVEHPKNIFMNLFNWVIRAATHSQYSHVAMVIRDPVFINPSLKGLYIWESSWEDTPDPQDGKIKLGVQISPLSEIVDYYKTHGHIVVRRINCSPDLFSNINLTKIFIILFIV